MYEIAEATSSRNASVEISSSREIAEIQAMMVVAKKFPRDEKRAIDKIMNSCMRPTLAEKAVYQYAKGGTSVEGASIRLAEAIAMSWGNINYGVRELEQRAGESTMEAFAFDMETNTRATRTFQVKHIRNTKKGSYMLEDSRDIYELTANQGARRLRACILEVIPGDIVEMAVEQCDKTLKAGAKITPETTQAMLAKFEELGVTKAMIETKIQRRVEAITPALVVNLRKIYNSIKDGMSDKSEWFDMPVINAEATEAAANKTETLAQKLKAKKEKAPEPDIKELPDDYDRVTENLKDFCQQVKANQPQK